MLYLFSINRGLLEQGLFNILFIFISSYYFQTHTYVLATCIPNIFSSLIIGSFTETEKKIPDSAISRSSDVFAFFIDGTGNISFIFLQKGRLVDYSPYQWLTL